jgi:tetratricopeptide (TPR) repeat protein
MRFADAIWRCCLLGALCAAVSGCASVGESKPAAATPAAPASGAGGGAKPPAGPTARKETPSGVSAAEQRAFDAALDALSAGQMEEAQRGFLALTQSHADLGGPHANLGIIYRQAGRLPQAVAELEQAVQLNPQQPVYLNQLGIVYRQLGQFGKAREVYEKAIALDPSYPAPYLNLGILFDLYFWDSQHALEFYDRYLSLTPGGDERVIKWVADIKNRSRQHNTASGKEQG